MRGGGGMGGGGIRGGMGGGGFRGGFGGGGFRGGFVGGGFRGGFARSADSTVALPMVCRRWYWWLALVGLGRRMVGRRMALVGQFRLGRPWLGRRRSGFLCL